MWRAKSKGDCTTTAADLGRADALLEGQDLSAHRQRGTGEDHGGVPLQQRLPQVGRHINRRRAEGDDVLAPARALEPEDEFLVGDGQPLAQASLVGFQSSALVEQLIAFLTLIELVGARAHGLDQGEQRRIEPRIAIQGIAHPDHGLFFEQLVPQEPKKLLRRFQRIHDQLLLKRAAMLGEQAAAGLGIVEILEHAVGAVAAEPQAEMLGRNLRHGVAFVEHDEIIGKQDAAGAAFLGGTAGVEMREQQRVVDDDNLGEAQPGPGALVETTLSVAMLAGTGRGIGADPFPDLRRRSGRKFMAQSIP